MPDDQTSSKDKRKPKRRRWALILLLAAIAAFICFRITLKIQIDNRLDAIRKKEHR